jgi:hypothetical protein
MREKLLLPHQPSAQQFHAGSGLGVVFYFIDFTDLHIIL